MEFSTRSTINFFAYPMLFLCAIFTSLSVYAEPATPEEFVSAFQSGSQIQQEKAAEALEWAGISSPKLFDLVEALALKTLPQATDKVTINFESYLVMALGYSGNEKYRPTIQKIIAEASNKKLKRYGEEALKALPVYAKLNLLIAPKPWPENTHPSINQRIINMLNSDDTDLMRLGAKRTHNTLNYSPELLAALNTALERNYEGDLDDERVDAVAWVAKALAGSREVQYKNTVEKVSTHANSKKLRSYAKKYLSYYGK
ncbi:MAG: hypothetical protein EOO52_17555 [Gammaproteobacteria bacterium]|nr:MAG: hypothetical protein EOO52_17555 [Gammaproteobacteria bacterium]